MATLDAMRVVNADGGTAIFAAGTVTADAGGISVESLAWSPNMRTTDQPKGDKAGLFESFAYVQGMTIEAAGKIVGTAATDYWGRRAVLAAAVLPDDGAQDSYNHGTVYATFEGTAVYAGVTVSAWEAPIDLTGPTITSYTIRWRNPDGYWRLVSTDAAVRL